jgi:hypothetical protein
MDCNCSMGCDSLLAPAPGESEDQTVMAMNGPRSCGRRDWVGLLALVLALPALLWGLLFVAVPPDRQDFPLNDDWKYAHAAFALYCGQGIQYFHSASMPVLGQWLWAWPFAAVLGNTHVALRLSTMGLALVGLAAFFDLLRQGGLAPRRAAFVAACLGLNPLYFLLSGTFMTDVPALAFSLAALALYGRAMQAAAARPAFARAVLPGAVVCAVLAAVTRQNTMTVPLAAGLVLVLRYPRLRVRPVWLLAVALPAVVALATHCWVTTSPAYLFW